MEQPPPQRHRTAAAATQEPTSILDIPDDLLRLIFLCLDSPLWLVRAACACRQFRRAIVSGGHAFLRLAASLHPPAIVGHYHNHIHIGRPVRVAFVPSSPAPAPIDSARFSLDAFITRSLATTSDWEVADCHGGLVLLRSRSDSTLDFMVCDPLTRRHKRIRHYPLSSLPGFFYSVGAFLLDGDDGDISVSNFRVLYQYGAHGSYQGIHANMFNTNGDSWCFLKQSADDDYYYKGHIAGRVDGSIYLGLTTGDINVLDSSSLKVSKVDMPIRIDASKVSYTSRFTVVHGAGPDPSSPPSTWIIHVSEADELELFRLVRGCSGGGDWVLEHTIPHLLEAMRKLPDGPPEKVVRLTKVDVFANGTGTALLSAWGNDGKTRALNESWWLISIAMDTKELQVMPSRQETYPKTGQTFTCALPWPRSLRAFPN